MHDLLGDENMFLFGLHADQAAQLRREGYVPQRYVSHDPQLERCLNSLRRGFRDGVSYEDLYQRLIGSDEYLLLADYRAYCDAERRMAETYENREQWNCMSLLNIARSAALPPTGLLRNMPTTSGTFPIAEEKPDLRGNRPQKRPEFVQFTV